MPRHARLIVPGLPVHVVQRGVNRSACFFDDRDRDFYLLHLARLLGEAGCSLHAFCLMTNHVHLLLTPDREDSCERLFRRLSLVYAQYMNRKHDRTGTLWEGRFRSSIVQSEIYLLLCYRYIELNPVRAGMVHHPAQYEWSSYAANAAGRACSWITPHAEYLRLGTDAEERMREYRGLFATAVDSKVVGDIRANTNAGYALGTRAFCEKVTRILGRRAFRGAPGRPPAPTHPGDAQSDLF